MHTVLYEFHIARAKIKQGGHTRFLQFTDLDNALIATSSNQRNFCRKPNVRTGEAFTTSSEVSHNTESGQVSFRKLRKIESGSSVTQGTLLLSARARASLAIEPGEVEEDAGSTPIRLALPAASFIKEFHSQLRLTHCADPISQWDLWKIHLRCGVERIAVLFILAADSAPVREATDRLKMLHQMSVISNSTTSPGTQGL